ncbi:hypothetical protein Vi05172_g4830 [Venturia inaequalis]|nr:hypothetical protein Vi05172_g4830 [Venturia inaequalis]
MAEKVADAQNFEKLKSAYQSCKDDAAAKTAGVTPLVNMLQDFRQTWYKHDTSKDRITAGLLWVVQNSVSALIRITVDTDDRMPDQNIISFRAPKISLPALQYYRNNKTLSSYTSALADMYTLLNIDPRPLKLESAVQFEAELAKVSIGPDRYADLSYYYNPTTLVEMDQRLPNISTTAMLETLVPAGYKPTKIINSDPWFFGNLSTILLHTSDETIYQYLQNRITFSWATKLHSSYTKPISDLAASLTGQKPVTAEDRSALCTSETDLGLKWLLSAVYVQRYSTPGAKELAEEMVKNVMAAFKQNLKNESWMSAEARAKAMLKMDKMVARVGFPTSSPNITNPVELQAYYRDTTITKSSFNNSRAFASQKLIAQWKGLLKTDTDSWDIGVSDVNANYESIGNRLIIPLGILQYPIFSSQLPEYISYGAVGSIAGHEITHGFDNNGAMYDENGHYSEWWDPTTRSRFENKTQCFISQYANFSVPSPTPGPPIPLNGLQTLGENIADAGGLSASFSAWKQRSTSSPQANALLPGLNFTAAQLFFLSYSTFWCANQSPERLVSQVYSDWHSPPQFRSKGATSNSRMFREAFGCKVREPVFHAASGYPVEGVSNPSSFITPASLLKAWVVLHGDKVVGHVAIMSPDLSSLAAKMYAKTGGDVKKSASLGRLFVDAEVRGRGFGTSLVAVAQEWAKTEGIRLLLVVLEKDEVAKRMYERLGWDVLGKDVYDDGEREHIAFAYASPVSWASR